MSPARWIWQPCLMCWLIFYVRCHSFFRIFYQFTCTSVIYESAYVHMAFLSTGSSHFGFNKLVIRHSHFKVVFLLQVILKIFYILKHLYFCFPEISVHMTSIIIIRLFFSNFMSTFSYGTQPFVISFATTFASVFIYFIIGIVFTITKRF